jgi:NhaP-type Na+/H+ or K+/H+ antiporter
VLGLLSGVSRPGPPPEPLIALLAGVGLGPAVLDLLDPADWGRQEAILEQAARMTLAISLMGVALRLSPGALGRNWRGVAILLALVMPLMWLASGLLVWLILGVPVWLALLVGAVVSPTDPVVATTIVTGAVAEENLPTRVRHTLSAESGFNDGLAYPIVLLPILVLADGPDGTVGHWLLHVVLWEVGGAAVLGGLLGRCAGILLRWAKAHGVIGPASHLAYAVALSLVALGGARLLGTDGILAVFVAGLAFEAGQERDQLEWVQEAVNRFFILPIFVLLGLALPWDEWRGLGWKAVALAAGLLLLRRLPAVLALRPWLGRVRSLPDALFIGWFGPVGVAALFYATLAERRAGAEEPWLVGTLAIAASVLAHGLSGVPFAHLYGRLASGSHAHEAGLAARSDRLLDEVRDSTNGDNSREAT